MKPVILVIDDEEAIRLFLESCLEDEGYEVLCAGTGQEALDTLEKSVPDLVLLDLMLPDMTGLQILETVRERLPHLGVIMITAYSETDSAVQAMKLDAFDYVSKPIQLERLLKVVQNGLLHYADANARFKHLHQNDLFLGFDDIVPSCSPAMLEIYAIVRKISSGGSTTVLIEGESGVGKDVVANLIHRTSARKDYPFLEINCAALPDSLLESELFGHEKGAFTDAVNQKMGLLELAHSGTLFLDEIGEMALTMQVKLLRVLEKRSFRRVGGVNDITVDVRVIAATNRNLAAQVKNGSFREDLYYRLKVVDLVVPPLRQRREDILPLAEFFLGIFNGLFGKTFQSIGPSAVRAMLGYVWPGNIRELKNIMERTILLEEGPVLAAEHLNLGADPHEAMELPAQLEKLLGGPLPPEGLDLEGMIRDIEAVLVRKALSQAGGNQSRAAGLLGLNRDKLRYRVKQYGLKES